MPKFVHYLYLVPLCLSAAFSIKALTNKWAKPYRLFSIFLMVTLGSELFAISWKLVLHETGYWSLSKSNLWVYNLYIVPQYLFYFLFYAMLLDQKLTKKTKCLLSLIYIFLAVANMIFIQSMNQLNTYTIILGGILVVICSSRYFIQEFNRKFPVAVHRHPLFWISLGALVFHSVSIPYFIFINYLSKNNLPIAIALFNILLALNIIMYSLYLTAFLCLNPSPKKPS